MVQWYWVLIAFVGGIFITIMALAIIVSSQDDDAEEQYKRLKSHVDE